MTTYEKAERRGLTRSARKQSILDSMHTMPRKYCTAREIARSQEMANGSHLGALLREMCNDGTISREETSFRAATMYWYHIVEKKS